MNILKIAARLDEAMKLRNVKTQVSLAETSGVPQPTIARILKGTGKQGPETETLRALAKALAVHLRWLQEGLGPMDLSDNSPDANAQRDLDELAARQINEAAGEMLRRATEMLETYRLAGPTDRERIDLVIREIRAGLGNKAKSRSS